MRLWPVGAVVLPAAGGMLVPMLTVMLTTVQRCAVCTLGFPRRFPSQPSLPFLGSTAWVFQNPEIPKHRDHLLSPSQACFDGKQCHPLQAPVGTRMKLPVFEVVLKAAAKSI